MLIEPELNSNTMFNTFQTLEHYQLFQSSSFSYLLVLIFIEVIYTKTSIHREGKYE